MFRLKAIMMLDTNQQERNKNLKSELAYISSNLMGYILLSYMGNIISIKVPPKGIQLIPSHFSPI